MDTSNYGVETGEYLKHGVTVFQSHLLGPTEETHCYALWNLMGRPQQGRLLDMGCGVGGVAERFMAFAPGLDIVCVTNVQAQVDAIRERRVQCTPVLTDFRSVPLPDGSADMVMFNESIGYEGYYQTMQESFRLLRDGGRLYVKDYARRSNYCPAEGSWGYRFPWAASLIGGAETCDLTLVSFQRLDASYDRYYALYQASEALRAEHPTCECDVDAAFYVFEKTMR